MSKRTYSTLRGNNALVKKERKQSWTPAHRWFVVYVINIFVKTRSRVYSKFCSLYTRPIQVQKWARREGEFLAVCQPLAFYYCVWWWFGLLSENCVILQKCTFLTRHTPWKLIALIYVFSLFFFLVCRKTRYFSNHARGWEREIVWLVHSMIARICVWLCSSIYAVFSCEWRLREV